MKILRTLVVLLKLLYTAHGSHGSVLLGPVHMSWAGPVNLVILMGGEILPGILFSYIFEIAFIWKASQPGFPLERTQNKYISNQRWYDF